MILVDTSGFYAYWAANDQDHARVRRAIEQELVAGQRLTTTSYVLSETMGLIQHRLGRAAVSDFVARVLPIVSVVWIGEADHRAGWALMEERPARHLTIVDATAMTVMSRLGLRRVLTLDPEFARQGFDAIPGPGD